MAVGDDACRERVVPRDEPACEGEAIFGEVGARGENGVWESWLHDLLRREEFAAVVESGFPREAGGALAHDERDGASALLTQVDDRFGVRCEFGCLEEKMLEELWWAGSW